VLIWLICRGSGKRIQILHDKVKKGEFSASQAVAFQYLYPRKQPKSRTIHGRAAPRFCASVGRNSDRLRSTRAKAGRGLYRPENLEKRSHLSKHFDDEGAISRLKKRRSFLQGKDVALQGKDVTRQLTEIGNCIHLKNMFTDAADLGLFKALQKDIEKAGKALRLHRDKRHWQIFGDDLAGSTVFAAIITNLLTVFDATLVDCWANLYRDGNDKTSYHHDNYQFRGPRATMTIGLSLGCTRSLAFENVVTGDHQYVPQENGDVFAFDEPFNNFYRHAVPSSRKPSGSRISGSRISVIIWANEDLELSKVRRKGMSNLCASREEFDWKEWPTMGQGWLSRKARKQNGRSEITSETLQSLLKTLTSQDLDDIVVTLE